MLLKSIPSVFTNYECEKLIALAEKGGFLQINENEYNGRKSLRFLKNDHQLSYLIFSKIINFIPQTYLGKTFFYVNPLLRFLKYNKGDYFELHRDGQYEDDKGNISLITVLIYLNCDYEGGKTTFYLHNNENKNPIILNPEIGLVSLMDQRILHEVPKLESGIKYVIRTELMYC